MKIVYIENNRHFHYEIIESIVVKYYEIINIKLNNFIIYLNIKKNESFENYIKKKYPSIKFGIPKSFDYYIAATIYAGNYSNIRKNSKTHFYISHEIFSLYDSLSNVYCLTPLAKRYFTANVFESKNKIKTEFPIYIIQGNLNHGRRNYHLLEKILSKKYSQKFKIKLVGSGKLPPLLEKYSDKIILKNNLKFEEYHKEFLDGYCILPLTTKKSHPQYYTKKLTSTMNYASGYDLKCLIDEDLQNIYQLKNVEIFKNENDIVEKFIKTLEDFYDKK